MKVFKQIIVILLLVSTITSTALFANRPDNSLKVAALSQAIREQRTSKNNERDSLIKVVYFENNIPQFLKLDAEFSDPGYLEGFLKHFDFMINDEAIPVYESKAIIIRKDKPFIFSIKAKQGKLESLLATQNWLKPVYAKAVNLFSFRIKYNCPLQEENLDNNNKIYMDELVYQHPEMREILKNPSSIMSKIKKYLTWSEWFGVEAHLPELKY